MFGANQVRNLHQMQLWSVQNAALHAWTHYVYVVKL